MVTARLGKTVVLPCKCGRWNSHINYRPKWINSRGKDVELILPGNYGPSYNQRKYILYNDIRYKKIVGDCSLAMRDLTREDEGEYTCIY